MLYTLPPQLIIQVSSMRSAHTKEFVAMLYEPAKIIDLLLKDNISKYLNQQSLPDRNHHKINFHCMFLYFQISLTPVLFSIINKVVYKLKQLALL